jgi:DNA-binding transcriptional MerR regulator
VVACIVAVQSERAPTADLGCGALAEYRLDDLARISGVSARNIRAYRERGLLDPPRRVGRSAYYDDYHLSQLKTINQLLRKGFNSAHIAEFFTSLRQGADLADILGIQRAVLGPRPEQTGEAPLGPRASGGAKTLAVDIDPGCDEANKLLEHGLAELDDGAVVMVDRALGEIVARSSDQLQYVRAILRIFESTRETVDELATEVVRALEECVTSRFGVNYIPRPEEVGELGQIVQDYRDLGSKVVAGRLDAAVLEQMVTAVSDYTAGILLSGQWEPKGQ